MGVAIQSFFLSAQIATLTSRKDAWFREGASERVKQPHKLIPHIKAKKNQPK